MKNPKGFLLAEVLILILILAVAFTAFIGVIRQALRVSSRSQGLTDAIAKYETLLFELESGNRADLTRYGGTGRLEGGYRYEIRSEESEAGFYRLKDILTWKDGRESLGLEFYLAETVAQ